MEQTALPRQTRYHALAEELRRAALKVYGERLVSLAIFGSVGRGTARVDSDVDLLLIAEELPKGRLSRVSEFEQVEERLRATLAELASRGIRTELSPVLKTPAEAEAGSLLFLDLLTDSVILFDRAGFLACLLDRLAKRLKELGARKIIKGNAWYWDLSPGLQAGEEFRLW
ncbi:MAG: nucleotidyltransferase domain-containing protein [Bacillota bacterium]|nr:nucleotidyltransferase domain-containing protein [Bacillota bacterium]